MKTRRGMTLVEIAVASAILSILLVMMFSFMFTLTSSAAVQQQVTSTRSRAAETVDEMAELLAMGMIPTTSWNFPDAGDNNVSFLVPVDHDGDGDTLDNASTSLSWSNIEWGSIRPDYVGGGFLNATQSLNSFRTIYRFVATGTFSEAGRTIDLNRDGDLGEVYQIGRLEKVFTAGTDDLGNAIPELVVPMTGDIVVALPKPATQTTWPDIDVDGTADPIFQRFGRTLRITLFVTQPNEETPVLVKMQSSVELKNAQ